MRGVWMHQERVEIHKFLKGVSISERGATSEVQWTTDGMAQQFFFWAMDKSEANIRWKDQLKNSFLQSAGWKGDMDIKEWAFTG